MQAFLYTLLTMSLAASIAALGAMLLRLLLNKANNDGYRSIYGGLY